MKEKIKKRWLWISVLLVFVVFLVGYGKKDNPVKPCIVTSVLSKILSIDYKTLIKIEKAEEITEIKEIESMIPINEVLTDNQEDIKEDVIEIVEEKKTVEPNLLPITNRQANDYYPEDKETIATISIPSLNLYQTVTYGDSQENIDTYEICLRTYQRFDQNGVVLLSGHNYKSFAKLKHVNIGNEIYIHSYYGDFTFVVDNVMIGVTDGENIYNAEGQPQIDYYSLENKLLLYTCDESDPLKRLLVSAHMK